MGKVRSVVVAGLCCVGFLLAGTVAEAQERPNILLFIGDDIDFSYFGFQGHEFALTPNLDQLAAEGAVFSNGYSTASVCQNSLRTLLAGVRSHTYLQTAADIRALHPGTRVRRESQYIPYTLPRLLRQVGYSSFAGGKMWEGTYEDAGFDAGTMTFVPFFGVDGANEFGRESMSELYDFIDAQAGPWFAWIATQLPHSPYDPPQELVDLYSDLDILPGAKRYFANLTRMDLRLGEIRAFLDDRGLSDNTIIIYLSDNGWEQRLVDNGAGGTLIGDDLGKLSVHDRGFKTPIIVHWPTEVRGGTRNDRIVNFEDVFETILDYADAPSHDCVDGRSFRRLADDGRGGWSRRRLVLNMNTVRYPVADVNASAMDEDPDNDLPRSEDVLGINMRLGRRWSYSYIPSRGIEELYDLRRDPGGLNDIVGERPGRVRGMRRRALRWTEKIQAKRCPVDP